VVVSFIVGGNRSTWKKTTDLLQVQSIDTQAALVTRKRTKKDIQKKNNTEKKKISKTDLDPTKNPGMNLGVPLR
jgi:hypothetical protein